MTEKQTPESKKRKEYVVGVISDFPEGTHKVVKAGRREVGIFNIDGKLYALPNLCPHQTGPLCEGKAPTTGTLVARQESDWRYEWDHEGEIVACPWHGLEYHVPTGQCIAFPNIRLRCYEVVVEDSRVKVRM